MLILLVIILEHSFLSKMLAVFGDHVYLPVINWINFDRSSLLPFIYIHPPSPIVRLV